jgi:hypothetical protein
MFHGCRIFVCVAPNINVNNYQQYQPAEEIDQKLILKMAKERQQWITQSQSLSLFKPVNGNFDELMELYTWSNKLQNCLSGYWKPILEKRTIVYGFFIDNEIKFAVEIKNNKIVQSKSKYNQDLQIREISLVIGWFTEYFEEKIIQNQS